MKIRFTPIQFGAQLGYLFLVGAITHDVRCIVLVAIGWSLGSIHVEYR